MHEYEWDAWNVMISALGIDLERRWTKICSTMCLFFDELCIAYEVQR